MRFAIALFLAATPLWADTIVCKDGRRIEGKITEETDAHVKVTVKHGAVTIPRWQIQEVLKGATREEIYEERRKRVDASDPVALLELARWCAKEQMKKHAETEFARVLEVAAEGSREAQEAHESLKHVKHEGKWMPYEDACRAKGLVEFDGAWMTPEEAKLKSALKEKMLLEKALADKVRDCLRKLTAADIEAREEAREQLEAIPADLRFTPFMENVEHRSAEIRSYVIGALSTYNNPEILPKVARRVLVDEAEAIREIAIDTLKKLNHPDTWIHLQRGLTSDYAQVRVRAANALAIFPNEKAAEALLNSLSKLVRPKGGFSVETVDTDPRMRGGTKLTPEAEKALKEGMGGLEDPREKAEREQAEKEKKAVVRALEACTGLAYGDDVDSWRAWWLQKHAATAAKEQMGGTEKPDEEKK